MKLPQKSRPSAWIAPITVCFDRQATTRQRFDWSAAAHDLFGLTPEGSPDTRPWLDHNRVGCTLPPWESPRSTRWRAHALSLPAVGRRGVSSDRGPGPVTREESIEARGIFRRLTGPAEEDRGAVEERLGYTHKGVEGPHRWRRISSAGGATLAGAPVRWTTHPSLRLWFRRAAEAAPGLVVPDRAVWLRALLRRPRAGLPTISATSAPICNDASFTLMHALQRVARGRCAIRISIRPSIDCVSTRAVRPRL